MTAREDMGARSRSSQRLSPERVRAQEFSRASLGRRGYNEEEVRLFIGRVAEDLAASDAEKASLRAEIDRLRRRYREQNHSAASVEGPPAEAVNLLSAAQQQADAYVAQAQEYCRQLTVQARRQADDILVEARDQAGAAAEEAARGYRAGAGSSYTREVEEMERRVAWIQTFCRAVQIQMQAASDAFSQEIARLSDFSTLSAERDRRQPDSPDGVGGAQRAAPSAATPAAAGPSAAGPLGPGVPPGAGPVGPAAGPPTAGPAGPGPGHGIGPDLDAVPQHRYAGGHEPDHRAPDESGTAWLPRG
ncbi:DivIVA domain-containing protein [Streptomonospora sp. S1-112]|uniref:Cell wall synthesis protein Wag31 n=1 Tax=Streptomonospora mangrovi TaxID=2883123 RepID=A0A9X3NKJ6_9ACTN|nr:DivIVA domain-containing protein [Streptomonospora mangrovi]MDA0564715.1 DivIVA domain-containing protein [Streptomonospora mangrovi]